MSEDESELLDLRQRAHDWVDTLQVSGISENAAVAAIMTAVIERVLRAGGVEVTVHWLRSQAALAERLGPELLRTIRDG